MHLVTRGESRAFVSFMGHFASVCTVDEVSYLGDMTNEEHDNNDTHNAHGAFAGVAMWNFPMEHHKCAN